MPDEQYRQFAADGYLVLRGAIREDLLAAADAEIDAVIASDPPPAAASCTTGCAATGTTPAGRRLSSTRSTNTSRCAQVGPPG
jgi:hypothetical protein